MPYNFVADSFHTINFVDFFFFKGSAILREKRQFRILSTLGGGLGATYDDHLRLVGKCVVDFLLVLIELISLGVTVKALRANNKDCRRPVGVAVVTFGSNNFGGDW